MTARRAIDDVIADSTLHLLRTGGPRSVTVEAVTAESGIAKTTIYRRHRDRRDMLSAALSRLVMPRPLDGRAEPPETLRWVIEHAVAVTDDGIGFGGIASLLTNDDPDFSAAFRQILVDQRAILVSVIDASKADGTIRPNVDAETLIDAIVGTYIAERARTGRVSDDWPERLLSLFLPAVAVTPSS